MKIFIKPEWLDHFFQDVHIFSIVGDSDEISWIFGKKTKTGNTSLSHNVIFAERLSLRKSPHIAQLRSANIAVLACERLPEVRHPEEIERVP